MFEVLIWTVAIFGLFTVMGVLCKFTEWFEMYLRWCRTQSVSHLDYSPKRYRTRRNYFG